MRKILSFTVLLLFCFTGATALAEITTQDINYIKQIKSSVVSKLPKRIDVNWAPSSDPDYAKHMGYCKTRTPAETSGVNCLNHYEYELKMGNRNYYLIYRYDGKLKFVKATIPSSRTTAVYAYPSGNLAYIKVQKSNNSAALFKADSKLEIFQTEKGCMVEKNSQYVSNNYTHSLCGKLILQTETVLKNTTK
jgi:hypothetical protein